MFWACRLSQVKQYTANIASVRLLFKQCALHSNLMLNQNQNKWVLLLLLLHHHEATCWCIIPVIIGTWET
jgi:hypothetical protein